MSVVTECDFLRERLGPNWVVMNRRSKEPRFDRRGFEQTQVTRGQYRAAEREYRALYGDPHDRARAQMYRALLACKEHLSGSCDTMSQKLLLDVEAAITAEVERRP